MKELVLKTIEEATAAGFSQAFCEQPPVAGHEQLPLDRSAKEDLDLV